MFSEYMGSCSVWMESAFLSNKDSSRYVNVCTPTLLCLDNIFAKAFKEVVEDFLVSLG